MTARQQPQAKVITHNLRRTHSDVKHLTTVKNLPVKVIYIYNKN